MTRATIRRGLVAGAAIAMAATFALAHEDPILRGVTAEYGPIFSKLMVAKSDLGTYTPPPPGVQLPDDPTEKPKTSPMSVGRELVGSPGTSSDRESGGGVGAIAAASPQSRLEKNLKDLARDLR